MRILLFLMLFLIPMNAVAATCQYKNEFNDEQWYNIRSVFVNGWLEDLSWSLASIIVKESSAGIKVINHRTKDYGIMQNNLKTAMKRLAQWEKAGRDFSPYDITNEKDVIELLVTRPEISVSLAIEELHFWKRVRGNDWRMIYASYNGGYYVDEDHQEVAEEYASDIIDIMRKLKTCNKELTRGLI